MSCSNKWMSESDVSLRSVDGVACQGAAEGRERSSKWSGIWNAISYLCRKQEGGSFGRLYRKKGTRLDKEKSKRKGRNFEFEISLSLSYDTYRFVYSAVIRNATCASGQM